MGRVLSHVMYVYIFNGLMQHSPFINNSDVANALHQTLLIKFQADFWSIFELNAGNLRQHAAKSTGAGGGRGGGA